LRPFRFPCTVRAMASAARSTWILAGLLFAVVAPALRAGPPFLTDDPVPVDLHHWEFYVFGQGDDAGGVDAVSGPAIELNYGVLPETQLHLVAPLASISGDGIPAASGYGDTEVGIKLRLLDETATRPQVGIFPMAELATGDASRGLGNGRTWYRLPVWIQKDGGPWTADAGGGVALDSAPGQRDYGFGGALLTRNFGPTLTLGGELFGQGADTDADRGTLEANLGGSVNFTPNFNLLFSAGHSLAGDRHLLWYLALYWTWGPAAPAGS
jgi:hypothetical protein